MWLYVRKKRCERSNDCNGSTPSSDTGRKGTNATSKRSTGSFGVFAAIDERPDRLVMGRTVQVAAFDDPGQDDTGQVWIPALKVPDGLGMVLVEMNEFAHLLCDAVPLELRCGSQFLPYHECTPQMQTAVVAQTHGLLDRLLAAVASGES